MPLPEDTRLMANGIQVPSTKNYMIDHNGNVYAYIEAQDAAVESEMRIAFATDGKEVSFFCRRMNKLHIISFEDSISSYVVCFSVFLIRERKNRKRLVLPKIRNTPLIPSAFLLFVVHKIGLVIERGATNLPGMISGCQNISVTRWLFHVDYHRIRAH